jgi:hypothetical protein
MPVLYTIPTLLATIQKEAGQIQKMQQQAANFVCIMLIEP